ncbi:MAG TPA: DsrE family protein [Egibacteraceae bacterium]
MARRVVSLVRSGPQALRSTEAVLEANAYAVAEDVDLTVVLAGAGVELAIAAGEVRPGTLAGVPLPPAASGQDLRGLLESGVGVLVVDADLQAQGLRREDLVEGVEVVDGAAVADALRTAEAVLTW